jgi:hypothetical protein
MSSETDIFTDGQTGFFCRDNGPDTFAIGVCKPRGRRRSRAIGCCSRRTRCRNASGVSIHPKTHVCPQALQSTERLIPVFCAVATHTPSQGDFCVTASHRFCVTVMAETRR